MQSYVAQHTPDPGETRSGAQTSVMFAYRVTDRILRRTKIAVHVRAHRDQRFVCTEAALATEEFGSVYESLLELHPKILSGSLPSFVFKQVAGNERKTTGSYYPPSSLVECLLDSALDPYLTQVRRSKNFSGGGNRGGRCHRF